MDIIILADFCGSFDENWKSFRFPYLAEMLSRSNKVELITSDFIHERKAFFSSKSEEFPFNITMLHETGYSRNVCLKRFMSHFIWGRNVKKYLYKRRKPDVVYAAVPTLYAAKIAGEYCRKYGIRFVIDIQDLWPEAFQMVMNVGLLGRSILFPIQVLANRIYRMADEICAVSVTSVNRALEVNKNGAKGQVVFLGTQLRLFDEATLCEPIIYKPNGTMWLGYCGSLSESYDIPTIICALSLLKSQGCEVPVLVIIGDGTKKKEFCRMAKKARVETIFTGKLSYRDMCPVLVQCDILVNPIVKNSAASIINKHADYAAAGRPVLNTQESTEYRNLIEMYNMGINCNNEDSQDLSCQLEKMMNNPVLREQMGFNARKCAEELFDRDKSYIKLIKVVEGQNNK